MSSQTMNRISLPIDAFLNSIVEGVRAYSSVIILAEPGAGKSTRVPVALLEQFSSSDKNEVWIMLQPRRWAAKEVARRVAEENRFKLGETVGYQVRFENKTSSKTRLVIMTEGVLLRRMLRDPDLQGVCGIILDEFHERSLDLDLSLTLLKELQESLRPDLKLLIMSATLDPVPLQKFLPDSKLFEVPGRLFQVHKKFLGEISVARAVAIALDEVSEGDGLVFLPGAREIDRAIEEVRAHLSRIDKKIELLPFYSSLSEEEQRKIFDHKSSHDARRRIIFSTNIAETSITLPRIKFVIDSGQVKVMRNDPRLGQDRLELLRVSRASSDQRAGRAGRVSEGVCYRLWSEGEHTQLRFAETPEIHRVSLSSAFLFLAAYGVRNGESLDWFEKPRSSSIQFAKAELEQLGLVLNGLLTDDGRKASVLPLSPQLAKLKIVGSKFGSVGENFTSRLAAFLEEDSRSVSEIRDWDALIFSLNGLGFKAKKIAEQILGQSLNEKLSLQNHDHEFESMLIEALPMRVFIKGKKVGRRNVQPQNRNTVLPEAGLILHSSERDEKGVPIILIRNFVPLGTASIAKKTKPKSRIEWDSTAERVRAFEGTYFEDLSLGSENEIAAKGDEVEEALTQMVLKDPIGFFNQDESFKMWLKRLEWWKNSQVNLEVILKDLSVAACQSKSKLSQVREFPWRSYLESSYPELQKLEKDLPEKIEVPSGSMIKIDYESDPPKLSVRLQEVFGWLETPSLMNSKVPLLLELLSPNFRPIQLTRDLKSFWKNAYFEVKKELKSRYPKHSWPEDPLTAKPEAKGRRR